MKYLLLTALLVSTIHACIPPIKPIPPIGCTYDDAVLVTTSDSGCYWAWMDCNG